MKRIFYTFLMMVLITLVSFFLYLSILTILARHRIIPLEYLDATLGMLMSRGSYLTVTLFGIIWGFFLAKKWWKIIYIDGVYYFKKTPPVRRGRRNVSPKN